MHRSNTIYKQKQFQTNVSEDFDVNPNRGWTFMDVIMDHELIFWPEATV